MNSDDFGPVSGAIRSVIEGAILRALIRSTRSAVILAWSCLDHIFGDHLSIFPLPFP